MEEEKEACKEKHDRRSGSEEAMKGGFSHFNISISNLLPPLGLVGDPVSRWTEANQESAWSEACPSQFTGSRRVLMTQL